MQRAAVSFVWLPTKLRVRHTLASWRVVSRLSHFLSPLSLALIENHNSHIVLALSAVLNAREFFLACAQACVCMCACVRVRVCVRACTG